MDEIDITKIKTAEDFELLLTSYKKIVIKEMISGDYKLDSWPGLVNDIKAVLGGDKIVTEMRYYTRHRDNLLTEYIIKKENLSLCRQSIIQNGYELEIQKNK